MHTDVSTRFDFFGYSFISCFGKLYDVGYLERLCNGREIILDWAKFSGRRKSFSCRDKILRFLPIRAQDRCNLERIIQL